MNYWKFLESEKQKGQELVVEIEEVVPRRRRRNPGRRTRNKL